MSTQENINKEEFSSQKIEKPINEQQNLKGKTKILSLS